VQGNLKRHGFVTPTPVQAASIPPALEGRDVVATAQTGTGKTLAFALPIVQRLAADKSRKQGVQAIVLAPTRELAIQTEETFAKLMEGSLLRTAVVVGGMAEARQLRQLRGGAQVMIATPGRLCDYLNRRLVDLRNVHTIVLDEADRMLDMGFLQALKEILHELPEVRQTLLFSATIEKSVAHLVDSYVKDPVKISIGAISSPIDTVDLDLYEVEQDDKVDLLRNLIHREQGAFLVFARTKHGTDKLAKRLAMIGVDATRIHGDRTQGQRNLALRGFKDGTFRVLVATDVAARGIHVDDIAHVVNFDLPQVPEDFIHRVGRTGRAGARGRASTFCTRGERGAIRRIERELSIRLERKTVNENGAAAPVRERVVARPILAPRFAAARPALAERMAELVEEPAGAPRMVAAQRFDGAELEQAEVLMVESRERAIVELREGAKEIVQSRESALELLQLRDEAASETAAPEAADAAETLDKAITELRERTDAQINGVKPRVVKPFVQRAEPRPFRNVPVRNDYQAERRSSAPAGWGESPTWSRETTRESSRDVERAPRQYNDRPSNDRPYRQTAASTYRSDDNRAPRQGASFRTAEQRPAPQGDARPYRPAAAPAPYRGESSPYSNNGKKARWIPRAGDGGQRYGNDTRANESAPRYGSDAPRRFANESAQPFRGGENARPFARDNRAAEYGDSARPARTVGPKVAFGGVKPQSRPGASGEKKPFWHAVMEHKQSAKFGRKRAAGSR
jgi:ATP-dependent RNA helicase RhlE